MFEKLKFKLLVGLSAFPRIPNDLNAYGSCLGLKIVTESRGKMRLIKLPKTILSTILIVMMFLGYAINTTQGEAVTVYQTDLNMILAELQQLKETNLKYYSSSGWLHETIESFVHSDPANVQLNENGIWEKASYSENTTIENWIQLQDNDLTLGKGSFLKITDPQGNVLQILATDETGKGGNLTLMKMGDYSPAMPPAGSPPAKLKSLVDEVILNIELVSKNLAGATSYYKDGSYFLELETRYQQLESSTYYPEEIAGRTYYYQIETKSGLVRKRNVVAIGVTGTEYLDVQSTLVRCDIVDRMDILTRREYEATLIEIDVVSDANRPESIPGGRLESDSDLLP